MSAPYTIWKLDAPFNKKGFPVMGTFGSTARTVVVMEVETLKRMLNEHASLATAEFRIGTYQDDEAGARSAGGAQGEGTK